MDAVAELWDADADFYPVRKFTEASPSHGRQEMARFIGEFLKTDADTEWVPKEVIAVGDDRVFSRLRFHAEGRASGVQVEAYLYLMAWFRRGRVLRMKNHLTVRGALRSLGLEGETVEAAGLRTEP